MQQPTSIFFFPNGNVAVCDDNEQIPELQGSWLMKYIEFLQSKGVRVEDVGEIWLPNKRKAIYYKDSHNWSVV